MWTNETSVVMKSPWGKVRVWQKPTEKAGPTVICRWWKPYSDFMLWGCFSDYRIDPCFVQFRKSAEEKKINTIILDALNEYRELICKRFWEEHQSQEEEGPARPSQRSFTKKTR